MTTKAAPTPRNIAKRRKAIRALVAILVGAMVGYGCKLLPDQYQLPCHLAAKLVGFCVGSP